MNQRNFNPRTLGANCDECPLKDSKAVPSTASRTGRASLLIVAESPSHSEEVAGESLAGAASYLLAGALKRAGTTLGSCFKTNATLCRPSRKLRPEEWKEALAACKPRLERELGAQSGRTILALGGRSLQTLTGHAKITAWMGAPLEVEVGTDLPTSRSYTVLPCVHPSGVLRKPSLRPYFYRLVERAVRSNWDWNWAPLGYRETEDTWQKLRDMAHTRWPLGVDVETAGIDPLESKMICVGVANKEGAVSIPWPPEDPVVETYLRRLLAHPDIPKAMHNGQHDLLTLKQYGIEVQGYAMDTLLAHATVASQMPHDLGFVCSSFFSAPRWKTEFRVESDAKGSEAFTKRPIEELCLYNAKDAYMTALLVPQLEYEINRTHRGQEIFDKYMKLSEVSMRMREYGIKVDTAQFDVHRKELRGEMDSRRDAFRELEPGINIGASGMSHDLKRLYFEELKCKPVKFSEETGEPSLDAATLQHFMTLGRSDVTLITEHLLAYRKCAKLLSTYVEGLPMNSKAEIHPCWKVYGTVTGRWSSSEPNTQNIPKRMRDLFRARPGKIFVGADFSQLELRIVALLARDVQLLEWYACGVDVHQKNAELLFKKKAISPAERTAAKKIAFAFNYNVSEDVTTVWRSLSTEFPGISMRHVKMLRRAWFDSHPEIGDWQKATLKKAEERGFVEEPYTGRREYFLDGVIEPNKVLNFPIQSLAGDIANTAILQMDSQVDWDGGEGIWAQVHDAVYLEGPNQERLENICRNYMPQTLNQMTFPVDVGTGTNWREL